MKTKTTRFLLSLMLVLAIIGAGVGWQIRQKTDTLKEHIQILMLENKEKAKKLQALEQKREQLQAHCNALSTQMRRLASDRRVGIHKGQLKELIRSTVSYFGERDLAGWTKLLIVTAAAESDMGFYHRQGWGPAKGIMQIEPTTERETLDWLKRVRLTPEDQRSCITQTMTVKDSWAITYEHRKG